MTKSKRALNPIIVLLTILTLLSCYFAWKVQQVTTQKEHQVMLAAKKLKSSTSEINRIKQAKPQLLPDTKESQKVFNAFMTHALAASTKQGNQDKDTQYLKYGTQSAQQALMLLFSGEGGAPKKITYDSQKMAFSTDYKGQYGLGTIILNADYGKLSKLSQTYTMFVELSYEGKTLKVTHLSLGHPGGE